MSCIFNLECNCGTEFVNKYDTLRTTLLSGFFYEYEDEMGVNNINLV